MAILPSPPPVSTTLPLPTPAATPTATPLVPQDNRDDKKHSPASTGHNPADAYQKSTAAKANSADSRNTSASLDDPNKNAKPSRDLHDDLSSFDPHADGADDHASAASDHALADTKADAKATTDHKTSENKAADKKDGVDRSASGKEADKARDTKTGDTKEAVKGKEAEGKEAAAGKDKPAAGTDGKAVAGGDKTSTAKTAPEPGKIPPTDKQPTPAQTHTGRSDGAAGDADTAKQSQAGDKTADAKKNDDAQAAARQQKPAVSTLPEQTPAPKPLQPEADKINAQTGNKDGTSREQQEGQAAKSQVPHGASLLGEAKAKALPPSKMVNPAEQKAATTATSQQAALAHAATRKDGPAVGQGAAAQAPQANKPANKSASAETTSGKDVERQAATGSGPKKTDTAEANAVHAKDDISEEASGTSASD